MEDDWDYVKGCRRDFDFAEPVIHCSTLLYRQGYYKGKGEVTKYRTNKDRDQSD